MSDYEIRTTALVVLPKGESIFSERGTRIQIEDEAAGEFLRISQIHDGTSQGTILIDPEEWPAILKGITLMLDEIQRHQNAPKHKP